MISDNDSWTILTPHPNFPKPLSSWNSSYYKWEFAETRLEPAFLMSIWKIDNLLQVISEAIPISDIMYGQLQKPISCNNKTHKMLVKVYKFFVKINDLHIKKSAFYFFLRMLQISNFLQNRLVDKKEIKCKKLFKINKKV